MAEFNNSQDKNVVGTTPWIIDTGSKEKIDTQELYLYIRENGNIRVIKRGNDKGVVLYQYKNNRYQLLTSA